MQSGLYISVVGIKHIAYLSNTFIIKLKYCPKLSSNLGDNINQGKLMYIPQKCQERYSVYRSVCQINISRSVVLENHIYITNIDIVCIEDSSSHYIMKSNIT